MKSPNVGVGYYSDQYHGAIPAGLSRPCTGQTAAPCPIRAALAGNGAGIGNPNSTDGTQVAYIQGGADFSQNITFAEAGTYTISFQAAYRQYGGQHAFSVLVDGVSVGTFNPTSLDFRGYSATFSVSAGTHRITFQGATESGDKTAFIDHVSIAKTDSLVQVSLSVDHGKLNMSDKNGLVFAYGDGVDDTSMTFTGSLADVNAALSSLQFSPYAGYMGTANLRITTNDLGNSGIGGPKSVTRTLGHQRARDERRPLEFGAVDNAGNLRKPTDRLLHRRLERHHRRRSRRRQLPDSSDVDGKPRHADAQQHQG